MKTFTEDFCAKLQEKSRELEERSSLEFVPVVVRRSDTYLSYRVGFALVLSLWAVIGLNVTASPEWMWELGLALVTLAGGFMVVSWPPLLRFLLPDRVMRDAVVDEADAAFLHEEVFATRQRTGILVFISLFEREVFVLADKGVAGAVHANYWKELGSRLARDFSAHAPGQSFFEAVEDLAREVAPLFPAHPENPNELPDHLRRR